MTTPQSGFAALNGTAFYYERAGVGLPLILVHAGICDSRMWDDQFAVFAQHYQVVRYDLRGYGQTPAVAGPFAHHADLYALLQYLGIERAHLLGCSMGGSACLDFALTYPAMVETLTLVGSSPSGYRANRPIPAQLPAVDEALQRGDFAQAAELEVQIWVDGIGRTPEQLSPLLRDRVRAMDIIALQNEVLELGEPRPLDPPAVERLHEHQVSTLLLVGDLDQPRVLDAFALLAAHFAQVQTVVIPGTAHLPNMEQPARFNELVLNFLAHH